MVDAGKVWTIIQARTGSTRLPGKVLEDLGGRPMIDHVYERAVELGYPVALAIPLSDLMLLCIGRGWPHFVGPEDDVLLRYVQAAQRFNADHIVRVTADCPFLDVEAGRWTIQEHLKFGADLTVYEAEGRGVEVFTREAMEKAERKTRRLPKMAGWREHPDEWILQHPDDFKIRYVKFSVDTPEELELARSRIG